jgi:hypothetical protein
LLDRHLGDVQGNLKGLAHYLRLFSICWDTDL